MGLFSSDGFFGRNVRSAKKDVGSAGRFLGRNAESAVKDGVAIGSKWADLSNKIVSIPGVGEAISAATGVPVEQISNFQNGLMQKFNNRVNGMPDVNLGAPQIADAVQHTVNNRTLPYASPVEKMKAKVGYVLANSLSEAQPVTGKNAPRVEMGETVPINPTLKGGSMKDKFLQWYYPRKKWVNGIFIGLVAILLLIWGVLKFKKGGKRKLV